MLRGGARGSKGQANLCTLDTCLVCSSFSKGHLSTTACQKSLSESIHIQGSYNHVREMSGNFTFQPDEAGMFGPDVSVLLNS